MAGRVWLPLLLLAAGCVADDAGLTLVKPNPFSNAPNVTQPTIVAHAPATEEAALRVTQVAKKVLDANKALGIQPVFTTLGVPQPEIFHRGNALRGDLEVMITEGLVRKCETEGQLAAVLCQELGRIVSEREALAGPSPRLSDREPPPFASIGNEVGGNFGPSDGTRREELARWEKDHPRPGSKPVLAPEPDALARRYLELAGYPAADFEQITPLLRAAEENNRLEKQMKTPPPQPTTGNGVVVSEMRDVSR